MNSFNVLAPAQLFHLIDQRVRKVEDLNVSRLYYLPTALNRGQLAALTLALLDRFPAFRQSFRQKPDYHWKVSIERPPLLVDIPQLSCRADDLLGSARDMAEELQSRIQLDSGTLAHFGALTVTDTGQTCFLVVTNRLAVDRVSMMHIGHFIIDYLQGRDRFANSSQFDDWLAELAQYPQAMSKSDHDIWRNRGWRDVDRSFLPAAGASGSAQMLDSSIKSDKDTWGNIVYELTVDETVKFSEAAQDAGVPEQDVILAAIASAQFEISAALHTSISLWDYGRPSLRFAKAVGPFAYPWPMLLTRQTFIDLCSQSKTLRERRCKGYGYLLGGYYDEIATPAIQLNFLGHMRSGLPPSQRGLDHRNIAVRVPSNTGEFRYVIARARILDSQLRIEFEFSKQLYRPEQVKGVADLIVARLLSAAEMPRKRH